MKEGTIIVIGGGAAGFFSAIHNKQNNPNNLVIIMEKSPEVLSKVKISGGGRCNVTQACFDPDVLCEGYPRGGKELLGPLYLFQPKDTMDWFDSHGVSLKIEPDRRVFPISDSSQDIIDCLVDVATNLGVKIWTDCPVAHVAKGNDGFVVTLANRTEHRCRKLILATGGSRRGHAWAEGFGHTIVSPVPSLFTFNINDKELHMLSGLSVEAVDVWLSKQKKKSQRGPLLITHWGMSGPSIIKLSSWHARDLYQLNYHTSLFVNWLPYFDDEDVMTYLTRYQKQHSKKHVVSRSPFSELPHRLWDYLVEKVHFSPDQSWHNVSAKQLQVLFQELRQSHFSIVGKGTFKEEFVTCGGVSLKEVNFKTMESFCCKGLYIIGELLDVDGLTGGFNFQNAWTTGFLSGKDEDDK